MESKMKPRVPSSAVSVAKKMFEKNKIVITAAVSSDTAAVRPCIPVVQSRAGQANAAQTTTTRPCFFGFRYGSIFVFI